MILFKSLRSLLRGFYYLVFRPEKAFIKQEHSIREKYYSLDTKQLKITGTTIIVMIDGHSIHGGLTDRLRGIVTIYEYCKRKGISFKLNYVYPFELVNYLTPSSYNWRILDNEISYNSKQSSVIVLNDYQLDLRLHKFYLDTVVRQNRGKQIHVYSNTNFYDNHFTHSFHELFQLTPQLHDAIEKTLIQIGEKYIAMVFRFQQLLGDFQEIGYKTLSEDEQIELIKKCIDKVDEVHHTCHSNDMVLVTSDSTKFLMAIKSHLNYIRIIPGKRVHMDHTSNATQETYMKSFVDLFMLAKAQKIYLLQTGDMYHSGFAKRASMINNKPYEEIIF